MNMNFSKSAILFPSSKVFLILNSLRRLLITTRNENVKKKLINKYESAVPEKLLSVFCASKTIYWKHRQEPINTAMPHLILSGILAIREHCMMMVSESQYKATAKYIRDDVGVLLGELNIWMQVGHGSLSAERKAEIRSTLDNLEGKLYLV